MAEEKTNLKDFLWEQNKEVQSSSFSFFLQGESQASQVFLEGKLSLPQGSCDTCLVLPFIILL